MISVRVDRGVVDVRSLVDAGQEAVAPELRTDDRLARAEHDEAGQVLVLGAQAEGQPRAEAGPDRLHVARVHHEQRGLVVGIVGVQRADDAQVVDAAGEVREQLGDLDAALAVGPRLERRRHEPAALGRWVSTAIAWGRWPAYLASIGLGSNVSTCDGPPFMNRKMTRFARAGKCGGRGASGFEGTSASDGLWLCAGPAPRAPASASTLASPRAPNPPPMRQSNSRREKGRGEKSDCEEWRS